MQEKQENQKMKHLQNIDILPYFWWVPLAKVANGTSAVLRQNIDILQG